MDDMLRALSRPAVFRAPGALLYAGNCADLLVASEAGKVVLNAWTRCGYPGLDLDDALVELDKQGRARLTAPLQGAVPAVGSKLTVGVRPEHFGAAGAGGTDIALDIDVAEHLGSTSYIYANTASGEQLVIEREETRHVVRGAGASASIDPGRVYLFDITGKRLR